jgi:hypothetical protein
MTASSRHLIPITIAVSIWLPSVALGADAYLCASDHSVGFSFDENTKTWKGTTFRPQRKFMVRRADSEWAKKGVAWTVAELASTAPDGLCKRDFSESGALICEGLSFFDFRMSNKTLRFLHSYNIGYWSDKPNAAKDDLLREGANSPAMTIGKCRQI